MTAQQEDQQEPLPVVIDTANTSTGLGISRETIAVSAPSTLHGTSEGPIIALEEPTAVSEEPIASSAPAVDPSKEPIAESAPASSLDKVRLSCPSDSYFLASVCVLTLVLVRILISPSCCPLTPHQLA